MEEILSSERVHRQLQATLEDTVRELTQEKKELGAQLQDSAINSQMLATQLQVRHCCPLQAIQNVKARDYPSYPNLNKYKP